MADLLEAVPDTGSAPFVVTRRSVESYSYDAGNGRASSAVAGGIFAAGEAASAVTARLVDRVSNTAVAGAVTSATLSGDAVAFRVAWTTNGIVGNREYAVELDLTVESDTRTPYVRFRTNWIPA